MKDPFNLSAAERDAVAESALKAWGREYEKRPDGTLFVPGDLNITHLSLTELPDLSAVVVAGHFYCHHNKLTSLKGMPQSIGGGIYCSGNQLTSLEGAPAAIGENLWCYNNRLLSLEHAPQNAGLCNSAFGDFNSWGDVPEELRLSPQTRARQQEEALAAIVEGATVLRAPVVVSRPLSLKLG